MNLTKADIAWQGIDHVALATPDLETTIHFYCDVLGMQAGEIFQARDGKTRHCFIKPGNTPAQGLHFWEVPDAQLPPSA
ncbi:VOC family protein [Ktedonosporobacter rubrisoli]|nr:VOC family protein [Ktedonosporobacter rubrisoli]